MPEFGRDTPKPTLRAAEERIALTRRIRQDRERVRFQSIMRCLAAPDAYSTPHDGNVLTTSLQYIYFPEDRTFVQLPF
jgi:hypothetical protein